VNGRPIPLVEGLDTYRALLDRAYSASPDQVAHGRRLSRRDGRVIAGSAYLGAVVPESADVRDLLGVAFASKGAFEEPIGEFREAVRLEPGAARLIGTWAALSSRAAGAWRDSSICAHRFSSIPPTDSRVTIWPLCSFRMVGSTRPSNI
jgi:hypothetical protein